MNETLRFQGAKEESFQSIMRRSLVIIMKARFFPKEVLDKMGFTEGDANDNGYFVSDPDLKDFLASPAAAAAMLRIITGFASRHTLKDLRKVLYNYAEGGGDGGLTRATMRKSCSLPAESKKARRDDMTQNQAVDPNVAVPDVSMQPSGVGNEGLGYTRGLRTGVSAGWGVWEFTFKQTV